jgi:hypothetical protein
LKIFKPKIRPANSTEPQAANPGPTETSEEAPAEALQRIGFIENYIAQHGSLRAIHGWAECPQVGEAVAVWIGPQLMLFRIIYDFPRQDAAEMPPGSRGYLAEVVYGHSPEYDQIDTALIGPGLAVVLGRDGRPRASLVIHQTVLEPFAEGQVTW